MKTLPLLAVSLIAGSLLLSGCSASGSSSVDIPTGETVTANTDPKDGWVRIVDKYEEDNPLFVDVYIRCYGTTLIYVTPGSGSGAHGISTQRDDPECVG